MPTLTRIIAALGAASVAIGVGPPAPAGASPARAEHFVAAERLVPAAARPKVRPLRATISQQAPIVGEQVSVTGRVPRPRARRVLLQEARPRGWRTVARTRTTRTRTYRFARSAGAAARWRVVAPAVDRARARRSSVLRVVPQPQQLLVTGPAVAEVGDRVAVQATLTPARPGRSVVLEVAGAGGWRTVATATQGGASAMQLAATADVAGELRLRVRAVGVSGAADAVSATHLLDVPEAPEPDPVVQGALPRVDITTDDGADVESRTDYSALDLAIGTEGSTDAAGHDLESYAGRGRARVRGNTTAMVVIKRSYKLKLESSDSLLGMPASKDWVLLANFFDRSMLRNDLAFAASRRLGLPWTPRMVSVEVWVNGTYRGVYQLGEGIEVQPGRVELDVAEDDPSAGGYLLEADSHADTDPSFRTSRGLQVYVKEPQDVGAEYVAGVSDHVQEFEDVLYGPSFRDPVHGYRRYVDVDSFVDWYLLNELTKNADASFNNSVWFSRDRGGLITLGPAWDYDRSAGNLRYWGLIDPQGWFLRRNWTLQPDPRGFQTQMTGPEGHWLNRMFEDPAFVSDVARRWRVIRHRMHALPDYVATQRQHLAPAATRNFAPRPEGAAMPIGPSMLDGEPYYIFHGSWQREAEALEDWIRTRVAWLDVQFG